MIHRDEVSAVAVPDRRTGNRRLRSGNQFAETAFIALARAPGATPTSLLDRDACGRMDIRPTRECSGLASIPF
jgi:hypothetical protein